MSLAIYVPIVALTLVGLFFLFSGGVGLIKFPDFYSRLHAASITDTVGAGALLIALMLAAGFSLVLVKLIFILILIAVTSPTATHALAKAAVYDDLRPYATVSAPQVGDQDLLDGDEVVQNEIAQNDQV